jgi:putative tryptophan/tyrosine transport system substrate-binding protein
MKHRIQFLRRRREFITLFGAAAAAWPVGARAQQAGRLPTIGLLGAATSSAWNQWVAAFLKRLRELGWIEGSNIAIEYRWAEGRDERYAEISAEFARLKVDVIVTSGGAVLATKKVTSAIPIVFAVAADPVGGGLVASLARPGGNVTGLSSQMADAGGKKLELLRDVLGNVGYPASISERSEVEAAARTMGLEVITPEIRHAQDIASVFQTFKGRPEAIYVCNDPFMATNVNRLHIFALAARLPTMHGIRERLESGGLMSYGPNITDLFHRAGDYVDKILRGAKPGDIPVEQPTKFDLVVNLITARALSLTVPPTLLARADEVIE